MWLTWPIEIAKGSASLASEKVKLADEPVHRDRVVTAQRIDPFAVALEKKTALLLETMEYCPSPARHCAEQCEPVGRRDRKLFVSTEGSHLEFDLLALSGDFDATAVHDGRFASRSFNTPHLRTGYELIEEANFLAEAPRVASQAVGKVKAPIIDARSVRSRPRS